uniref:LIM domain-binding protein 3-like isoform X2 n=1 Tax=Myxine glutinosa TaxID=7769 RepID=UPI00358E17C3
MSKYTAKLEASPPWGFRLQGGRDFNMPLTLSRVTPGSKADRVSMEPGDLVMSINGLSTDGMTHLEAQNHIKANTGVLHLGMQRGTRVPPVPTATPIIETAPVVIPHQRVVQLNLSNTSRSSGYQAQSLAIPLRPKNLPSEGPMNIRVAAGPSATITHAQYNTPISLYSSNAILATIAGQARALGADITGLSQDTSLQPKDVPVDTTSPVFQAVVKSCEEEDWSNKSSASQSRSFNILAQMTGTHNDDSVPEQTSSGQSARNRVGGTFRASLDHTPNPKAGQLHHKTSYRLQEHQSNLSDHAEHVEPGHGTTAKAGAQNPRGHQQSNYSVAAERPDIEDSLRTPTKGLTVRFSLNSVNNSTSSHTTFVPPLKPAKTIRHVDAPRSKATAYIGTHPMTHTVTYPVSRLAFKQAATAMPCATVNLSNSFNAYHSATSVSNPPWVTDKFVTPACSIAKTSTAAAASSSLAHTNWPLSSSPDALANVPDAAASLGRSQNEMLSPVGGTQPTRSSSGRAVRLAAATISAAIAAQARGSKGSLPNVNSRSTALIAHHLAPGQQQRPEPQPVATATVAVKTVSRKPPVTSPARQPVGLSTSKNVVQAPSFSRVTDEPRIVQRSSPSSSRKEGGLLQQVEHVPAGIRTPLCGHCGSVIRGPFLIAEGRSWHKDEFCCCRCKQSLAETGYVPESEKIYCQGCYAQLFAPACSKCKEKIVGEVTYALKQAFHSQCFLCAACGTPIGKSTFHMEDGEPYCDKDFYSLFSTKCLGCDFPVEAGDRFIEALGSTWHDTCFMCTVCQVNLEGQQFYSKNGKPLCRKHAG